MDESVENFEHKAEDFAGVPVPPSPPRSRPLICMVATALLISAMLITGASRADEVEIVGTVEVVQADDFENDRSETIYWLIEEETGKPFRLRTNRSQQGYLVSGTVIRARGQVEGDEFVISSDGDSTESTVEVLQSAPAPSVERSLAVIVVDFQDVSVTCSTDAIAASVFSQPTLGNANVSGFYIESSYAEMGFQSDSDGDGFQDVFGPYKVNAWSTDACDYYGWAYEAEDLAIADGVDLTLYRHLLFVLPSSNGCSGWGVANVGCGTQCRAWVWRCGVEDLYAHEIGHNLGFRHSSTDTNNDGTVDSEYGDYSDIMGYSGVGWRHPNAPHKDQQGWFKSYPEKVVTLNSDATLRLAPLELYPWETTLPQVIKLYKPDTNEYYYLSYRTKLGYSSALRTAYTEALNIHRYRGSGSVRTNFIKALQDGEQFQDALAGFTVTQLAHDPDPLTGSVDVAVTFGCAPTAPSMEITPAIQYVGAPATSVDYRITVTNNDGASCSTFVFALTSTLPSGWSALWSVQTLSLAPGASLSKTLTVTSPADALDGVYAVSIAIADSDGGHPGFSVSANYVLDTQPPETVSDLSGTQDRKGAVQLSWSPASDGSGTADSYDVLRDAGSGFETIATVATSSFKDTDTAVSTDMLFQYYVIANDSFGNSSGASNVANVPIKMKTKGKGSGGGGGENPRKGGGKKK